MKTDVLPDFEWSPPIGFTVEADEFEAAAAFRAMLADPDWLMPLVAAQSQVRAAYYGMTAAALLEDVWTDALANWIARHRPAIALRKSERGALGDYEIGGLVTSHKSGLGPQTTAVHWDATVESGTTWTSKSAVTYLSAQYGTKTGTWLTSDDGGSKAPATRVVWPVEATSPPSGKVLALLTIIEDGSDPTWLINFCWPTLPSFDQAWAVIAPLLDGGTAANNIEMMWLPKGVAVGDSGRLGFDAIPGVYVWPKAMLVDVPIKKNNRGTTIPGIGVQRLMSLTLKYPSTSPLYARLPVWPARYAPARPPDLYLSYRADWDRRFSPVRTA